MPGSLVFGGYDASRSEKGSLMQARQSTPHEKFEVMMNSITVNNPAQISSPGGRTLNLGLVRLSLDFSATDLELPMNVCNHIANALGLDWDEARKRYTVNDTQHNQLTTSGASMNFVLSGSPGPQKAFNIPYASLVLDATSPRVNESSRHVAIRHSGSEHYNFGRAFFQDTVITAHYDRPAGPFVYLAQAKYNPSAPRQIKEINTQQYLRVHQTSRDNKIGVILPIVFCVTAFIAMIGYLIWARKVGWIPFRYRNKTEEPKESTQLENASSWPADRKEEPNTDSVYYDATEDPSDPLEGSSNPPPRYSMAVAEARKEQAPTQEGKTVA
jgi:Eukaryotic aspartyl protease